MDILKRMLPTATLLLLTGCYEDFDPILTTDEDSPRLCINALISPGEPVTTYISHTWRYNSADSEADHSVSDAQITVTANGAEVGDDYLPAEGDHISISARSTHYGQADAETVVPQKVDITVKNHRLSNVDAYEGDYHGIMSVDIDFDLEIELTFTDPAGVENFYEITCGHDISGVYHANFFPGTLIYKAEPILTEHIGIFETMMGTESDGFTFFTDKRIDGETYTLRLHFKGGFLRTTIYPDELDDFALTLNFYLKSISQSYYRWATYQWQTSEGLLGDLSDIGLGNPLWGYSNVSTGAGVVAAQTLSTTSIRLPGLWWRE